MTLRERVGNWISGERAGGPPIDIVPQASAMFGPGLGNQPNTPALLRENQGTSDAGTRAIANRVAALTWNVVTDVTVSEGTIETEILDDHRLKMLLDKPHPSFLRSHLFRLTAQYLVTNGEAYWSKTGSRLGVPIRLAPVPPTMLAPIVRDNVVTDYLVTDANGSQFTRSADTILRFYWPDPENPFGAEGYLGPNAVMTDASNYASQHIRSHYKDNAIPPAWIKAAADAVLPQQSTRDRFLRDYIRRYNKRAGEFAGAPAFLPPGFDIVMAAMQSGAEIVPLLDYFDQQQLRNFGVPRSVLGEVVSGDRSSAETNQFVFDMHTVEPIAQLIADTLTANLAPDFDERIRVEVADFVSRDKAHELKQEDQDLRLKVRTINQVRTDRGFDEVEWGDLPVGTHADVPYTGEEREFPEDDPDAIGPVPEELEPDPMAGDEDDEEEDAERGGARSLVDAAWARQMLYERQYGGEFRRAMKGIIDRQRKVTLKRLRALEPRARVDVDELFRPSEWFTLIVQRMVPVYRSIFGRSGADAMKSTGALGEFVFNEEMERLLRTEAAKLVKTGRLTQKRIRAQLGDAQAKGESIDQMARRLNQVFAGRKRDTRTIARTETLKASQAAQVEGFKQSGVVEQKQWNTSRDAAVRDSHVPMDGVVVGLDADFDIGGERASGPGDSRLSARNVVNCRCFVTPVIS